MNNKRILLSGAMGMLCVSMTSCESTQKRMARNTMQDKKLHIETITAAPANAQRPKQGDRVTVHYTGWLPGKENDPFDSSVRRGQPFSFILGVGQVIKGWDEGVAQMQVGGKYKLHIPSDLGYGARGAGSKIPAHADLVFEVELIGIG